MSPLSFDNGWTDRKFATRIVALTPSIEKNTTAKNLVNFDPVTPEILWLIYMGGEST